MRSFFVAAFLAFAAPCLAAPVELPVNVADGATWTIKSTRVRLDERKDGPRRTESASRYKATYRQAKGGGRITLEPIGGFFLGDLPAGMKLDGFDIPLELEVDEALTPVRLTNWPQVRDLVYKMLGAQDPKVVEGMRSIFDGVSDTQATAMFLPHMSYLGLGQGLVLELGKSMPYEDSLPNPLGGPPIKTQSTFILEGRDPQTREATVVWTQSLDRDSMAASMRVSIKALLERMKAPADGGKMEAALREMEMSRNSRCRFVIDEGSGLAREAECSSVLDMTAQAEKVHRSDTWTITQTLPGQP